MALTVTPELPDELLPVLERDAQLKGVTVTALVREKITALYEQETWEWGEITDEERRAIWQAALEREDLWGSEADKVWDTWAPSNPGEIGAK